MAERDALVAALQQRLAEVEGEASAAGDAHAMRSELEAEREAARTVRSQLGQLDRLRALPFIPSAGPSRTRSSP